MPKWQSMHVNPLDFISLCGSRGTWQSEQAARTPERFLSWIVSLNSLATLSRISWHMPPQNASELVHARPAAPPASSTPQTRIVPREMTHHFIVGSRREGKRRAGRTEHTPCP